MTREEAIKRLKEYAQYSYGIWHNEEEDTKAFDMAIEALQTEVVRCGECKKQFTNNCYMIYGKNMMRNLFDNDFCSYGERRERDDENTAEDKDL